jgi:hypothetical protein
MEPWTVAEMHELAHAIVAAGDCFYLRRLLRRLERRELELGDVLARLTKPAWRRRGRVAGARLLGGAAVAG